MWIPAIYQFSLIMGEICDILARRHNLEICCIINLSLKFNRNFQVLLFAMTKWPHHFLPHCLDIQYLKGLLWLCDPQSILPHFPDLWHHKDLTWQSDSHFFFPFALITGTTKVCHGHGQVMLLFHYIVFIHCTTRFILHWSTLPSRFIIKTYLWTKTTNIEGNASLIKKTQKKTFIMSK